MSTEGPLPIRVFGESRAAAPSRLLLHLLIPAGRLKLLAEGFNPTGTRLLKAFLILRHLSSDMADTLRHDMYMYESHENLHAGQI
ncbi:hypothetical protein SKAU_G00297500 [Synaphobranchus kaupii]|uniref:Uncharacterized protein n=1 Tax=Synaphobranchus kaupii TaxID=118154 RepID=A0A9Q1EV35_SYNKA|nr:hypothetical protein SKAU_G00297500 [Synaphobranchus kaupii]